MSELFSQTNHVKDDITGMLQMLFSRIVLSELEDKKQVTGNIPWSFLNWMVIYT